MSNEKIDIRELGITALHNAGCSVVHEFDLKKEIKRLLLELQYDILDYAMEYADEECIEIRYDIL